MSYLDVNVLRRFTNKLANSTMDAPDLSMGDAGRKPMNTGVGSFGRPMRENEIKEPELATTPPLNSTIPEFADRRPNLDLKGESSTDIPARSGIKQHVEGGLADANSALKGLGIDTAAMNYGSTAGGLGGGLAGGMGAMSLANMFRSEKDKEEGNTPWWSALAGAGGAVGGGVLGAQYLPQLLAALTAQKSTPSAAAAAPAAAKA